MKSLPLLLLAAAAVGGGPRPGLWAIASAPSQATLDGRPLGDLPYTPSDPERRCLATSDLVDPIMLVTRQTPPGCTVVRRAVAAHRVTLTGTCAPQAQGLARGSFRIDGNWAATSYSIRFTTANPSENGVMGFTGRIDARRLGNCG